MLYIISDMNITSSVRRLEREIETLRRRLLALGPLHPGSISEQYHVCRNPGCCCMHPHRPQRHGPYHKLAYVHRGQPRSEEHTSELQSPDHIVCRLLLEKKKLHDHS